VAAGQQPGKEKSVSWAAYSPPPETSATTTPDVPSGSPDLTDCLNVEAGGAGRIAWIMYAVMYLSVFGGTSATSLRDLLSAL
jgi:hypothetical protein